MKKPTPLLVATSLLFAALVGSVGAADRKTLTGEYIWNQGPRDELRAVFTATGKKQWNVAFHFDFQGKKHTYRGTAAGTLADGSLRGEVMNESQNRTFTFTGAFEGKSFSGTHAEVRGGKQRGTGTLTLSH